MKNFKICPRCNQGILYIYSRAELEKDVVICDECYSTWLDKNHIFYGEFGKDFFYADDFFRDLNIDFYNDNGAWDNKQPIYE